MLFLTDWLPYTTESNRLYYARQTKLIVVPQSSRVRNSWFENSSHRFLSKTIYFSAQFGLLLETIDTRFRIALKPNNFYLIQNELSHYWVGSPNISLKPQSLCRNSQCLFATRIRKRNPEIHPRP